MHFSIIAFFCLMSYSPDCLIVQNSYRSIAQCFATTSLPNCLISNCLFIRCLAATFLPNCLFILLSALLVLQCLIAQFPIAFLISSLLLLQCLNAQCLNHASLPNALLCLTADILLHPLLRFMPDTDTYYLIANWSSCILLGCCWSWPWIQRRASCALMFIRKTWDRAWTNEL